jgi:hypothetical protein
MNNIACMIRVPEVFDARDIQCAARFEAAHGRQASGLQLPLRKIDGLGEGARRLRRLPELPAGMQVRLAFSRIAGT